MSSSAIRQPAVSGLFYPAEPTDLLAQIDTFLHRTPRTAALQQPKALIVPHAGYVYSGPIAAYAYQCLRPFAETIRQVVLLGPAHRVPIVGLALPESRAFRTPLGTVAIDELAAAAALHCPEVSRNETAHLWEHALEVQLPFLQRVLTNFAIVPFVVGWTAPERVTEVIERLWGGEETLIVVSSDLSHYHPDAEARRIDQRTIDRILHFDPTIEPDEACGSLAIDGLVLAARRRGLAPQLLAYGTSADTEGPRDRVVGYTAIAWYPQPATALSPQ